MRNSPLGPKVDQRGERERSDKKVRGDLHIHRRSEVIGVKHLWSGNVGFLVVVVAVVI